MKDSMDDTFYMKMALDLAELGRGHTSPNPMVGAVVVSGRGVLGKGWHARAGKPHAEVNALDDAGDHARGATLYVTLEPCNHTGRTPPCTERILSAGIHRVVIAANDPNPGVTGGGAHYLSGRGIEITTGVCEEAALRQNEAFFKFIRTGRPFVILKAAATLDGRIASRTGDSKWITGPSSRRYVHELRHGSDAIMVGVQTVAADNPSLTTRLGDRAGSDPHRVILDTRLSVPEDAKVLQIGSASDTFIVFNAAADPDKPKRLADRGIKLIEAPLKGDLLDLGAVLDSLGRRQITSLLIEGGSRVMGSAIRERIADKVHFFYAPKILGGDDGIPICSGPGPERIGGCVALDETEVRQFDGDVLITGYIHHPPAETGTRAGGGTA
jgi:diaminohydroxyphosphoribosylaminopyrimidine deaminase/5-amino-6-(5-phosphoribosylamino)uracil reductase